MVSVPGTSDSQNKPGMPGTPHRIQSQARCQGGGGTGMSAACTKAWGRKRISGGLPNIQGFCMLHQWDTGIAQYAYREAETCEGGRVPGFPRLFSAKFVPCCIHHSRTSGDLLRTVTSAGIHAVEMGGTADGSEPVFVLVHGLGMSGRYMMPTAELLSPWGRVHVPDLPGFGRSPGRGRRQTVPGLCVTQKLEILGTVV